VLLENQNDFGKGSSYKDPAFCVHIFMGKRKEI
jgi:hypothetical protein